MFNLRDIAYLGIVDSTTRIYYDLNYSCEEPQNFFRYLDCPIGLYKDQVILCEKRPTSDSVNVYLVCLLEKDSNEIFVKNALVALMSVFDKIMKNGWSLERVQTKYDLFIFVMNEFVFNGIILEDEENKLWERLQKRTFESIGGIKVNRGLASMLNKAAKSMKDSFTLKK